MKQNIQLIVIDPQNDFCDLPEHYRPVDSVSGRSVSPSLPVAGAHQDMLRLSQFLTAGALLVDDLIITLDSHHRVDIAHPTFWQTGSGEPVAPFTQITAAEVRSGKYKTRDERAMSRALTYIDQLETRGRYKLMVWPIHCEIGTWGHNVHPDLRAAYNRWEEQGVRQVRKVIKGTNPWTEHYSAIQAEVPEADDPTTQMNVELLAAIDRMDLILIAGEASSHCVKATTEDIVANLPSGRAERLVLLTDCMSPVAGFEAQHEAFLTDMRARGVRLSTSVEMLTELR